MNEKLEKNIIRTIVVFVYIGCAAAIYCLGFANATNTANRKAESNKQIMSSTSHYMSCINCGFIGAVHFANGIGPYCGECVKKAVR